jgi:Tol biopolymer transport system component
VSAAEKQANNASSQAAISKSGRFVAFASTASNLVARDTNRASDVFVRDVVNGTTRRVSVSSNGKQGNSASVQPTISADGRTVAYVSQASNLVKRDTNNTTDVFLWRSGTTRRLSVGPRGRQANGGSFQPAISAGGAFVAFESEATNLVSADTNHRMDVFRRGTRGAAKTERVSVATGGGQANGASFGPALSSSGRVVAFMSAASNLVADDTNAVRDVFIRTASDSTERVSVGSGEEQGNRDSTDPTITARGDIVAFASEATNLVLGDTNGDSDVFVRTIATGMTEAASVRSNGDFVEGISDNPSITYNGRVVVFTSAARGLVGHDTNRVTDVFGRNRGSDETRRLSVRGASRQANGASDNPVVSGGGGEVAYDSVATNLVASDTNRERDVFTGPVRN